MSFACRSSSVRERALDAPGFAQMVTPSDAFSSAIACLNQGRFAEAENFCRQVLAEDPQHSDAWHLLGVLAQQAGQHESAADFLGRSVALNPTNPEALSNLGVALSRLGRRGEAAGCLARAVELAPDFTEAHYNLARVLHELGRLREAVRHYRRSLALQPDLRHGVLQCAARSRPARGGVEPLPAAAGERLAIGRRPCRFRSGAPARGPSGRIGAVPATGCSAGPTMRRSP